MRRNAAESPIAMTHREYDTLSYHQSYTRPAAFRPLATSPPPTRMITLGFAGGTPVQHIVPVDVASPLSRGDRSRARAAYQWEQQRREQKYAATRIQATG